MNILPTKYFIWMEPRPFLAVVGKLERRNCRWWSGPLVVLIVVANGVAMFWLQWFVAKHRFPARHLNTDLATFLGVSVAMIILGCIYAFGLPWVVAKCPSRIVLYDCYLQRCRGQCVLLYFKNVASFSLNVGAEFSTLVLKLRSGRESFIGVPNDMPMEEIRLFLCERIPIEA